MASPGLPTVVSRATFLGMVTVSEAGATAIRAAFGEDGELAAALEGCVAT